MQGVGTHVTWTIDGVNFILLILKGIQNLVASGCKLECESTTVWREKIPMSWQCAQFWKIQTFHTWKPSLGSEICTVMLRGALVSPIYSTHLKSNHFWKKNPKKSILANEQPKTTLLKDLYLNWICQFRLNNDKGIFAFSEMRGANITFGNRSEKLTLRKFESNRLVHLWLGFNFWVVSYLLLQDGGGVVQERSRRDGGEAGGKRTGWRLR